MIRFISLIFCLFLTVACSQMKPSYEYPLSAKEIEEKRVGKLTGDGIYLTGGNLFGDKSTTKIAVNSFLWQASLDVLDFMPLNSTDAQSGIIISDWYQLDDKFCNLYKINIFIKSKELKADSLNISVFKNNSCSTKNIGSVVKDDKMGQMIKDKIIERARFIKVSAEQKTK